MSLRPVTEDDLPRLDELRADPVATGPHEWHGWHDPGSQRRRWAESGLLGDSGGTLMVIHSTGRAGSISWRKDQIIYSVLRHEVELVEAPETEQAPAESL